MAARKDQFRAGCPCHQRRGHHAEVRLLRQRIGSSPDWDVWKYQLQAPLYQVVALSLNIDPENIPRLTSGTYGELIIKDTPPDFQKRLKVAINHTESGVLKTKDIFPNTPLRTVEMTVFYNWVERLNWSVPEEFPRQSFSEPPSDQVTKKKGGRPSTRDWEGAICATMAEIFHGRLGEEAARPQWIKYMTQWLADRGGPDDGGPSETEVRKRAALIEQALATAAANDENC